MKKKNDTKILNYKDFDQQNYGLDAAIMIYEFKNSIWVNKNQHSFQGETWFALSEWDLQFLFPYWGLTHIHKLIRKLLKFRVLKRKRIYKISRCMSFAFVKNESLG